MSSNIDFTTVTASIAALSVTGVKFKDLNQIPDAIGMQYKVVIPRPQDFVTNLRITQAEISQQNLDVRYTLNYLYFHTKIGGGSSMFKDYKNMITNLAAIVKAFANDPTLSGAIDQGSPRIGQIGVVTDSAGNMYHGCALTIDVLQFLEV